MLSAAAVCAALCAVSGGVAACGSGVAAGTSTGPTLATTPNNAPSPVPSIPGTTVLPFRPTGTPTAITPSPIPAPTGTRVPVPKNQISSTGMSTPPVTVMTIGNDVSFVTGQSGCQQVTAAPTAQTATSVTIQVTITSTVRGNQVCPMYVRELPIVVQLTKPLGDRSLKFVGVMK